MNYNEKKGMQESIRSSWFAASEPIFTWPENNPVFFLARTC